MSDLVEKVAKQISTAEQTFPEAFWNSKDENDKAWCLGVARAAIAVVLRELLKYQNIEVDTTVTDMARANSIPLDTDEGNRMALENRIGTGE